MTQIRFTKETHIYEANIGDGVWTPYISGTTFCGRYSPPFPKEIIAARVAEFNSNEGLPNDTIEGVLEEWEKAGEVACDFGNSIHGAVEMWIKYGRKPKAPYLLTIVEKFIELKLGKCAAEKILFNDDMQLAGTADILEQVNGKEIALLDIKTNGDLYTKKGKLLPPFNHLASSNLNKYRLQLSLYAHLLTEMGYTVTKAEILHVIGDEIKVIPIELEDMTLAIEERIKEVSNTK